tara:strand:+ start:1074 stop:1847 length:774 start_codon:yes stop_codon:yes gene_type:complete
MLEDNKVIKSLWIGYELSNMEKLCIKSFLDNGHEFHLYTYQDVMGIPEGTVIKDGNEILSEDKLFFYTDPKHYGSYSAFSNWFRYKMLYELGGWWVDMDMVCLKPFDFDDEYLFSSEMCYDLMHINNGIHLNCGAIKVPKNSDLMKYCWNKTQEIGKNVSWGQIGPSLLREGVEKFELMKYLKSPNTFCPIHYMEMGTIVENKWDNNFAKTLSQKPDIENETYAIHLWNEGWRINNINKDISYNDDTLYEQLKRRYL